MKMTKAVVAVFGCCAMSAAFAATTMKPGMWEITTSTDVGGMAVKMPKLTPEQQAQMEKAGVKVPKAGGTAITIRQCVTKEQAEKNEPPQPKQFERMKCDKPSYSRSGNTTTWKVVCTGERPMTSTGTMTMESSESYSGVVNTQAKDTKYGDINTTTKMQGKWLAASCQ